MNAMHSFELAVQPFKDGSYLIFWSRWLQREDGTWVIAQTKTAATSHGQLGDVLENIVAGDQALTTNAPGEKGEWFVRVPP